MMATDSPMTTKGRAIGRSFPHFHSHLGRSQMANIFEFIEDHGYSAAGVLVLARLDDCERTTLERAALLGKTRRRLVEFYAFRFSSVDQSEPVTHVSYFEADAYANWAGARLPTEFEWERAALSCPIEGNFVETELFHPVPVPLYPRTNAGDQRLHQMFGDVWEWTRSAYSPYPGYRAVPEHLANTTANSCATNTSCAVGPARHRAFIFAAPIATFSNRKNAGNSPESDWRATHSNSVGRVDSVRAISTTQ